MTYRKYRKRKIQKCLIKEFLLAENNGKALKGDFSKGYGWG